MIGMDESGLEHLDDLADLVLADHAVFETLAALVAADVVLAGHEKAVALLLVAEGAERVNLLDDLQLPVRAA
jgi:hypothetical protein